MQKILSLEILGHLCMVFSFLKEEEVGNLGLSLQTTVKFSVETKGLLEMHGACMDSSGLSDICWTRHVER